MKKIVQIIVLFVTLSICGQVPSGDLLMGLHQINMVDVPNITNPIEGSLFYNTTEKRVYIYKPTGWEPLNKAAWSLEGNSISATDFIGSTNSQDLVFKTNNAERMRLNKDQSQLLLNEANVFKNHPLIIKANGNNVLAFQDQTGDTKWHWNLLGNGLNFVETGVKDYRLFLQNGGNVGIDTSNPQRKLEVNGIIRSGETNSTTGTTIIEGNYSGDNVTALIGTKRSSGNLVLGYGVRPNNTALNYISSANNVSFQRSALEVGNGLSFQGTPGSVNAPINSVVPMTELFKILPSGNTGIGTSTPHYKLEVNGTAKIDDTPTITTATKALVKDPSTGQISEQDITNLTISGKFFLNFSGRAYFYNNAWYGLNNNYGTGYPHWNSYKGVGSALPVYSTTNQNGIPITSDVNFAKFLLKSDFNSTTTDPQLNFAVMRQGSIINIGTYSLPSSATTVTFYSENVNFPLKEGDFLVWACKSAGPNRLNYASLTFEFTY